MTTDQADLAAIGARIKHYRELAGLTQTQLAVKLGPKCTQARVSKWENGKNPPDQQYVSRLCKVLGIAYEELWYGNRSTSGGHDVTNEQIRKALSPEWGQLALPRRHALAELLNDADLEDWEARSILATLIRGWEKRGENEGEIDGSRPSGHRSGKLRRY